MGGKSAKREIFDFLMSIDYGMCHGPVDRVNQIYVKDKPIWCGDGAGRIDVPVNQPDLFGGDDGEGGAVGVVEVYPGSDDQVASVELASRVGRTPETMPGYRGLCHLFFRGFKNNGFRWSSNNPYLPPMSASMTRLPAQLSESFKRIHPPLVDDGGNLIPNPNVPGSVDPEDTTFFVNGVQAIIRRLASIPENNFHTPWVGFNWKHLTDEEIALAVAKGWKPQIRIVSDWVAGAADDTPQPYTLQARFEEYNGAGVLLNTINRSHTDTAHLNEIVNLNPNTREIRYTAIFQEPAGLITKTLSGGTRAELLFTEENETAGAVETMPFFDSVPELSHESNGARVDLYTLGYDQVVVDDGLITVQFNAIIGAEMNAGAGAANFSSVIHFKAWGQNTDGSIDFSNPVDVIDVGTGTPAVSWNAGGLGLSMTSTARFRIGAGARYVTYYTEGIRLLQLFSFWTGRSGTANFAGPGRVPQDVHCNVNGKLGPLPDANPAHIIYECLTNAEWGKGEDPAMIDSASFLSAAETLFDEFFGLSMLWVRQSKIEDFIQEVLDHIRAMLFQDPATGLWNLKLLRNDYDADAAPLLSPKNCTLSNRVRRAWGETINEIVVTYTDPQTEKEATVVSHNLGNIATQGGVISENRNYYGVRNPILAKVLADRDVEVEGFPTFGAQAIVDRSFWNLRPGDVVRINWPQDGIVEMVCRVMGIDYGSPKDRKIKLDLTEDIFAVERSSFSGGQGSLLETENEVATPLAAQTVVTAPLPSMVRNGAAIVDVDAEYPRIAAFLLADGTPRPLDVEAHTEVLRTNGDEVVESIRTFPVARSTLLLSALTAEATSTLPGSVVEAILTDQAEPGDFLMLGSAETGSELVMLDSYNSETDVWTIARGMWDTVPGDWPIGTRVWDFPDGTLRGDPNERAAGETRTYRFLPKTSNGRLLYAEASDITVTYSERPFQPFRPANCQLDGTGFAGVDYSFLATGAAPPATVTATWSNRNRQLEDQVAPRWSEASASPETGQTTVLRIIDGDGVFSHEIVDLPGASYAITLAEFAPVDKGWVEFVSERDGFRSFTGIRLPFDISQGGYGINYGASYGP